jgi:hypothetical protein
MTSDEKRGNPQKTERGSFKSPPIKKGNPKKHGGAHLKDLQRAKRQS